ncbi:relaxase/mobilization nuclease domain-containing protein [Bacteroides fragilis]|nr:relaxase/mobilization nuclease domain-containing protein [Bacteroides fragilis]
METNSHPEAAASNVKQGQYSPRKRKDTTPRVNPQLAVELVYQELKRVEVYTAIAKERNFVQSQDIGKVNKAEIKEAMDGVLKKMQGFDFTKFKEELGKRGFKVREARASTGKLNGYYVTARSGTEYKASEIGKGYTLAHIERTQSKLKCNSMNISHGNKLTPGSGSFQR